MSHKIKVKEFIINEYLPEGYTHEIPDDMNLLDNGIMDSLGVLKLVAFIENNFNIALDPEEIDPANLNSINAINELITAKVA